MSHLGLIDIEGPTVAIATILTCIQLPEGTTIRLTCEGESGPTEWDSLFRSLSLHRQARSPIEVLRVDLSGYQPKIEGWTDPIQELDPREPTSFSSMKHSAKLVFTSPLYQSFTYGFFLPFIESLNLTTLKALSVVTSLDGNRLIEAAGWPQVFQRLTGLQILHWHVLAVGGGWDTLESVLLRALEPEESMQMAGNTVGGAFTQHVPSVLPQLESLILQNVKFMNYRGKARTDDPYPILLRACTMRRRGMLGLKHLSIFQGVNIGSSEIQALQQVVTEVIWDGECIEEEEPEGWFEYGSDWEGYDSDFGRDDNDAGLMYYY